MSKSRVFVTGSAMLVAGALAASCSSEAFVKSGTGGDAGTTGGSGGSDASVGGSGGTGGATGGTGGATGGTGGATGGTGGATGCTKDGDCDDKLACNGQEKCSNGSCVAGTPVECTTTDTTHCEGVCKEDGAGSTSCVVKGKDADGDKHLDAKCTASSVTADDCDDSAPTVYPGATELCDGIDNDCNGKDELEDGAALAGNVADFVKGTTFGAQDPAIAWSPTAKEYGVVWTDDRVNSIQQIYFARMSVDGNKLGTAGAEDVQISSASPGSTEARIAWGNGVYGLVWRANTSNKIMFREVGSDGKPVTGTLKVVSDASSSAEQPDIAATSSGWIVVWSDARSNPNGAIYARALAADGTPAGGADTQVGVATGANVVPRIAAHGTDAFVTWTHGSGSEPNVIKTMNLSSSLAVSNEKSQSPDPPGSGTSYAMPAVTAAGSGWSLAWRQGGGIERIFLSDTQADGTGFCNYPVVPFFSTPNVGVPGGIASRGVARVAAYGEGVSINATINLVRFKSGCAAQVTRQLATADVPSFDPRGTAVAWSDNGIAIVWMDQSNGTGMIRRWVSGPNLCDAPVP